MAKRVYKYTVALPEELYHWIAERAGGGSISPIIVFLLNERRLSEQGAREVKKMRQLTKSEISQLQKLSDITPTEALEYLRDKNSVDFEVWNCKRVPKDFYKQLERGETPII